MNRIDGIAVIAIGLFYGWKGAGIVESKVGTHDQVGSSFFPLVISGIIVLCGMIMFIKGDGVDHRQVWPPKKIWKTFGILILTLFVYGLLFEPLGFLLINFMLCIYLGLLLKSKVSTAVLSGLFISLSIFALFNIFLEINLPLGPFTFIDDWIYGY